MLKLGIKLVFAVLVPSLVVLAGPPDLWGQTSAATVDILECVDWDLEQGDPEMFPYRSTPTAPVYFDFHRSDIGDVTRLTPYFNRDIECRDKPALEMLLKKRTLSIDHPLFPKGTGPTIEFERGKDYRDGIINFLDLIHEHHFLKLPGQQKITIRKSISNKHDSFEFPQGATFVHKVTLRSQPTRPLEMRMLVKSASGWIPVLYLPENDVLFKNRVCAPGKFRRYFSPVIPSHDYAEKGHLAGHEGSFRRLNVSKSLRDLGWFESEKYGRMRVTYPVVGIAHCMECHGDLGPVQSVDRRRVHQFVSEADFGRFQGRSFYSLNDRIRRLDAEIELNRARWRALTAQSAKIEERGQKKEPNQSPKRGKVCGPDSRTAIDPDKYREEVQKLLLGDLLYSYEKQQDALARTAEEIENNADVTADWPTRKPVEKPQFPRTLQGKVDEAKWRFNQLSREKATLLDIYNVPERDLEKKNKKIARGVEIGVCGFVDLADIMPFNADLVGYSRTYQRAFGSKPFQVLNPRECKLTEIRIGERVTMMTPAIPLSRKSQGAHGPRSEGSLLSLVSPETDTPLEFVVTEKSPDGVMYGRLVNRDLSPADRETQVILSQLKSGDIAFELRFKDGRDQDHADNFYVSYEGVVPPTLKYLSCLDSDPVTPHENQHAPGGKHDMARMNREMANPFRFGRGTNFFNIHLIHSAFGIVSKGAAQGNQVASTGHVMGSFGRRFEMFDGRFVLRAEYLLTPDRWLVPERGILSPLTYGDPMKRGGVYKGAQHPHGWLGILQGGGCFLWGSEAYTCLSAGLIGDVAAGINYMRASNQNLVIKEGGPHHALEVFHAFQRNPVQVKTVIGPWRFDFSAFSGSEVNLWSNDFGLKRLDSYAGRVQRDWRGQTFGASYAHLKAQHAEQESGAEGGAHREILRPADTHGAHGVGEERAKLERVFNAWHEGSYLFVHRKLKEVQWDMTNAFGLQKRAVETPSQLLTFLSEHMLTFANKRGLSLRFDIRQVPLSDAVEVKVTDPNSGAQWVRNYTVGYFRTLRDRMKTSGYRVDAMVNYTRTSALPRGLGLPQPYENPSHTFAVGLRFQFMKSLGRLYHGVGGH